MFYQNHNSAAVSLQKFPTVKERRKGPQTVKNLQITIVKTEKNGSILRSLEKGLIWLNGARSEGTYSATLGKGKKPVPIEEIQKVVFQIEEGVASNKHASATVQNITWIFQLCYLCNLKLVQKLVSNDFKTQHR